MSKNTNKVSNMYGRARRIAFAKKCIYIALGFLAVFVVIKLVTKVVNHEDENVNFYYLRKYMEVNGYSCERLDLTGGSCTKRAEVTGYNFIRYDDGFEYQVRTSSYTLTMRLASNDGSKISFKTTTDAIAGYKGKNYTCTYKENILNELDKCTETSDFTELDLGAYRGVIEKAIFDLNEIVDASGYKKDVLVNKFEWIKK